MNKTLPNKWIRKAVLDSVDGLNVNGQDIPIFDTKVTGPSQPDFYILMTTQSNDVDRDNKCEDFWDSTLLLAAVTKFPRPGNPGSRVLSNNIIDAVRDLTKDLTLDPISDLEIIFNTPSFPDDLVLDTPDEIVYQSFLRLNLKIE